MKAERLNYIKPAVEVILLDTTDIIQTSGSTDLLSDALFQTDDAVWREDWGL